MFEEQSTAALSDANSADPFSAFGSNHIVGPAGFGPRGFLASNATLPFTLRFANDPEFATAPALEASITHELDGDLDATTVELGDFGFGPIVVDTPPGLQFYQTVIEYQNQDGSPLLVDVTAHLEVAAGVLRWTFRSVDPATGFLPTGVFDGFLPVNDETGVGAGFVGYRVRAKTNVSTAAAIDQQASIVFDVNAPIVTNTYTNTVDAEAPTSHVEPLPAAATDADITVVWSGTDGAGSGIAAFDVFVSIDGGPFQIWRDDTTATSAVYHGDAGHAYAFYSVATDHVGWVEAAPAAPDAQTAVGHSWTNSPPADINNDTLINLADLLALVQFLRENGTVVELPIPGRAPPPYVDANRDGRATILDVVHVVEALRTQRESSGQGEVGLSLAAPAFDLVFDDAAEHDEDALMDDATVFQIASDREMRRCSPSTLD